MCPGRWPGLTWNSRNSRANWWKYSFAVSLSVLICVVEEMRASSLSASMTIDRDGYLPCNDDDLGRSRARTMMR